MMYNVHHLAMSNISLLTISTISWVGWRGYRRPSVNCLGACISFYSRRALIFNYSSLIVIYSVPPPPPPGPNMVCTWFGETERIFRDNRVANSLQNFPASPALHKFYILKAFGMNICYLCVYVPGKSIIFLFFDLHRIREIKRRKINF
jgi:hypothetical protein